MRPRSPCRPPYDLLVYSHGSPWRIAGYWRRNNLQLKAGGLVLTTESPDTGHRPVVMAPCESYRADLAQSDVPNIRAPSLRSSDQRWHSNSLVPRSGAPSSAFSAWGIPRTACSRRGADEDVHLILAHHPLQDLDLEELAGLPHPLSYPQGHIAGAYLVTVLGARLRSPRRPLSATRHSGWNPQTSSSSRA
jgi:hypothetical protein